MIKKPAADLNEAGLAGILIHCPIAIYKNIYYLRLFNIMTRRLGVLIGLGVGILLIASAVIVLLFLGSLSFAYGVYRDSCVTATTSSSIWIINMTAPPYNETVSIPSNLNIIYSTLANHGVTNYTLAVLIRSGNYYYALFTVETGSDVSYVGVFVHGNTAEVDDELRRVLFNESIIEKRVVMSSDEYTVDIIKYKLFNLTSPILKTYFPDATFFGGMLIIPRISTSPEYYLLRNPHWATSLASMVNGLN